MNVETRERYYRAEFLSMGDVLKDGRLNQREFSRLVRLLGVYDPALVQTLWTKQSKQQVSKMNVDEYVALMMNPAVDELTSMWRKLFAQFDTDGSGYASRQEVIAGLEKMGVEVGEEMRAKIRAMDSYSYVSDRVYYGDFLKMQLLEK